MMRLNCVMKNLFLISFLVGKTFQVISFSFGTFFATNLMGVRSWFVVSIKQIAWFCDKTYSALFMGFVPKCLSVVQFSVFTLCNDLKVINRVVQLIMVNVMHFFVWVQFSAYKLFHNIAVFFDSSSINGNRLITFGRDTSRPRRISNGNTRVSMLIKPVKVLTAKPP